MRDPSLPDAPAEQVDEQARLGLSMVASGAWLGLECAPGLTRERRVEALLDWCDACGVLASEDDPLTDAGPTR